MTVINVETVALTSLATTFSDYRVIPYGMKAYLLADIDMQLVSRLFSVVIVCLAIKHMTRARFPLHLNGQAYGLS